MLCQEVEVVRLVSGFDLCDLSDQQGLLLIDKTDGITHQQRYGRRIETGDEIRDKTIGGFIFSRDVFSEMGHDVAELLVQLMFELAVAFLVVAYKARHFCDFSEHILFLVRTALRTQIILRHFPQRDKLPFEFCDVLGFIVLPFVRDLLQKRLRLDKDIT